jgi:hypothetical protein
MPYLLCLNGKLLPFVRFLKSQKHQIVVGIVGGEESVYFIKHILFNLFFFLLPFFNTMDRNSEQNTDCCKWCEENLLSAVKSFKR